MNEADSEAERMVPETILDKWQGIVDIMAEVIDVPYAIISKIDPPHYEIFKINFANPKKLKTGDICKLNDVYCEFVFRTNKKLLIPDALLDDHWRNHPEVRQGFLSYLGFPIFLPNGKIFGTICILDTKKNLYSNKAETLIKLFKDQIEAHLGLHIQNVDLEARVKKRTSELTDTIKQLLLEINNRNQAFNLLKESEERFRSLVENSPIGKSIWKRNKIVYQNPEHRRILGSVPGGVGFPYIERVYAEDVERIKRLASQFLEWKPPILDMIFRVYPFGAEMKSKYLKWVQCRAIHINYGNEDAVLATLVDITRTRELELLVRIEDKMSALGRVATGIAHEILSPLSAINMNLSTLQEVCLAGGELDDESVRTVNRISEIILEASSRIETIIKNVTDFARPSLPQLSITDVNRCIESAINLSAAMLRKIGIKLQCDLTRGIPDCLADPQMIEEVLLNLISNSSHALQNVEGMRMLTITSKDCDDSILIRVADSGPGIPEEIKEKVFDPFFTTKADGIGIGLSLVNRIIKDHGGQLSLGRSQLGGAEFTVTIPAITGDRSG
jgi:PAS domain S-box-containing protein